MSRIFTCIVCPNGCEITAEQQDSLAPRITGASCPRGEAYVRQELLDPRRTIATSVLVRGGDMPLCSVRLTAPIPKARIFDAMACIRAVELTAPVAAGTVVIENILGLGSDVIATRDVGRGALTHGRQRNSFPENS